MGDVSSPLCQLHFTAQYFATLCSPFQVKPFYPPVLTHFLLLWAPYPPQACGWNQIKWQGWSSATVLCCLSGTRIVFSSVDFAHECVSSRWTHENIKTTIKCREFPLEFCIVQMQHQFHCSMSAHHCFQIAPWSIRLWPSYYSAYPVSCWGNLVKQSPLSLSEDKWVLTGGADHLSPRKHWTPFVWRVPLITGTSSAVPLVTELVDCWAALGSSLLSILVGYRVSTPFLMDILMKINGFMWSPGTWPLSLCQH